MSIENNESLTESTDVAELPKAEDAVTPETTPDVDNPPDSSSLKDDPADAPAHEPESETVPLTKYKEEVSKRNSEAASLRSRLKKTESEYNDTKEKFTALEDENNHLKAQVENLLLESKFVGAASDPKLGCKNPLKLLKLVDRSNLEFSDDKIEGIDKELKRLKAEWPELFHDVRNGADGGAGIHGTPEAFDMNDLLRQKAGLKP